MQHASPPSSAAVPIISSIAPIAAGTEAWLVDIWGVMHNGVAPFAGAVQACRHFRAKGGVVLLLSNAPRPRDSVAAQLDRIGVSREAWDGIVSSGDAARAFIDSLERREVLHLGPERDLPIYDGLAAKLVRAEDAAAIVCTGLFDDETETPRDYEAVLRSLAARALPMVCANPDLTVERGGRIVYCAGSLAKVYEALGGRVTYAGKPYQPVYRMAYDAIAQLRGHPVERTRMLAIGDGVNTDIKGAAEAGIKSVYIASGVHVSAGDGLDDALMERLFPDPGVRPAAAMPALAW